MAKLSASTPVHDQLQLDEACLLTVLSGQDKN